MKHVFRCCLIAPLAMLAAVASAEEFGKVGTFGAQFLKLGVSARATAMGSAYSAVADDAEAVYWNPAGIVGVRGSQLNISQTEWPADIKLSFAAWVFNPRSIPGTFALSARALWMDPQVERTAFQPEGTGRLFDSGMSSLGLTYSRFFTDKFSAGATLHYVHMGLADVAVNTSVADIGILYRIGIRGMRIGMTIQSLGGDMQFDERSERMPTAFKVGFSFEPIRIGQQKVIASSEFQHPVDNVERANFGVEYNLNNRMYLRSGYSVNYDSEKLASGAGFRVSTGRRSHVQVDYGFVDMESLGFVHRVSVGIAY